MIDDLTELVAMYNEGSWSTGDFFHQVTLLVPQVAVQTIIEQLPGECRDEFADWLRKTYDNDLPADAFISIGQQDDLTLRVPRLAALRAWLRSTSNTEP